MLQRSGTLAPVQQFRSREGICRLAAVCSQYTAQSTAKHRIGSDDAQIAPRVPHKRACCRVHGFFRRKSTSFTSRFASVGLGVGHWRPRQQHRLSDEKRRAAHPLAASFMCQVPAFQLARCRRKEEAKRAADERRRQEEAARRAAAGMLSFSAGGSTGSEHSVGSGAGFDPMFCRFSFVCRGFSPSRLGC